LRSRIVMLVDLDYFFAQCEELRNPSIRDKPVVICVYSGRSEESGAVSTANYIARNFGVKSGMPIFLAKKKLKDVPALYLPVDHEYYEEVSEKVMNTLRVHGDCFEQVGIDEAFLDVTKRTNGQFAEAKAQAIEIKDELVKKQGLTCSIGVGPNKLIAKLAADVQKPNGLTVVEPSQIISFLTPLPTGSMIGIGAKTKEKLQSLGINTIGQLAEFDVQKLIAIFGKTLGTYFHNASLGIDDEPVAEKSEAESISRIITLKEDSRDLGTIVERVNELCDEIHDVILKQHTVFKTLTIIVIATDLSAHARSKTLEDPTDDIEAMKKTAEDLFRKFLSETDRKARRVGVKVSNLARKERSQKQLTSFIKLDDN
jgi:DNA polymerase IV (DinB-like DNA polymerase)